MENSYRDGWLILVGLAYPVVSSIVMCVGGARMGLFPFHPVIFPLPALVLIAIVVGMRVSGVRIRWWVILLFIAWLSAVVFVQMWIVSEALGAV